MLNKGTLDSLINSACGGDEVDLDKLCLLLNQISDKIFGIGEPKSNEFPELNLDSPIITSVRGVKFPFARVDANGIIHLGRPSGGAGTGFIALDDPGINPNPAGSAAMNGAIWVQKGSGSIVWYSNNGRFFITGTPF